MFTDRIHLTLSAGKGGNGIVAWRREKYIPKGGPAGGDGGHGGSITLLADPQVLSLEDFRNSRIIKAENGRPGEGAKKHGKNGSDRILKIPPGTLVKDIHTNQILFDFVEPGQKWVICKGGKGGKGNVHFKTATNQAPQKCTEGTEGQTREVELELKLIADVGLIGMPNAGKSTLISEIAHVPVKIAPYPFTTLRPNLAMVEFEDFTRVLIADIPGIIKDAHENKGLGISFLRHIERTSMLIYVIDISGEEGRDPFQDFLTLQKEIKAYKESILEKPFLIALNKVDQESASAYIEEFKNQLSTEQKNNLLEISGLTGKGLSELLSAMYNLIQKVKYPERENRSILLKKPIDSPSEPL